ncbi:hypothetical protein CRG98_020302 [Punica granatum]|uniref:Uncharacterized protein n=1 Tax=Punica granatum TaxID=22663 RepID=A0A2I0JTT3_PUNGR|nr:hypothetical protein CRG98_020302 [Punica granatum]
MLGRKNLGRAAKENGWAGLGRASGSACSGPISGETERVRRQTGSGRLGWTELGRTDWTCVNRRKVGRARERGNRENRDFGDLRGRRGRGQPTSAARPARPCPNPFFLNAGGPGQPVGRVATPPPNQVRWQGWNLLMNLVIANLAVELGGGVELPVEAPYP